MHGPRSQPEHLNQPTEAQPLAGGDAFSRLLVLFEAAAAVQEAEDEAAVLNAVAGGLARIGVSAHLDLLRPMTGDFVLERAVIEPAELLASVEDRLGRPLRGVTLDPEEWPYDAVLRRAEVVRVSDVADWLSRALPWLDRRAVRLFGRLPALGQGVCAPITDGATVLGAVSVWGDVIGEADVPAIALLGRHAGGALSLLRLRSRGQDRVRLDAALLVSRAVAHEINNAFSPIIGGADLLGTVPAVASDPAASAYLKMIVDAAGDVASKVRRLQRIVRVEQTEALLGPGRPVLDLERSTDS